MAEPKRLHVYIMTNGPRSHVLYTGVTGDLSRRVFEQKNKLVPGFTSRYNLTRLVYYECFVYPIFVSRFPIWTIGQGSAASPGFAREIKIHRAVGRRLVAQHANHADDLSAMQLRMFDNVPQNFPARQAPLNPLRFTPAGKLQIEFDF